MERDVFVTLALRYRKSRVGDRERFSGHSGYKVSLGGGDLLVTLAIR